MPTNAAPAPHTWTGQWTPGLQVDITVDLTRTHAATYRATVTQVTADHVETTTDEDPAAATTTRWTWDLYDARENEFRLSYAEFDLPGGITCRPVN